MISQSLVGKGLSCHKISTSNTLDMNFEWLWRHSCMYSPSHPLQYTPRKKDRSDRTKISVFIVGNKDDSDEYINVKLT